VRRCHADDVHQQRHGQQRPATADRGMKLNNLAD
jgi:hypothetical protein